VAARRVSFGDRFMSTPSRWPTPHAAWARASTSAPPPAPASSTTVNSTGMTSRLRKVEVIRPPITTMAIGARKLGSTPRPSAMGIMPAPIAMVVMTIGRARLRQASSTASQPTQAVVAARQDHVVDQQDRVLRRDAHQHDQADHRRHRQGRLRDEQRQERTGNRQHQRTEDRHRLHEVLEQQHQHDVDAQHAGQHRQAEAGEQLAIASASPTHRLR
jgi:hypothetical protein